MAVFPVAIAFLVGLAIGAVIVALANDKTMDFSINAEGARIHVGKKQKA